MGTLSQSLFIGDQALIALFDYPSIKRSDSTERISEGSRLAKARNLLVPLEDIPFHPSKGFSSRQWLLQ